MTEKEKMLSGKIYDGADEVLLKERILAHKLSRKYNNTDETERKKREKILNKLLPNRKGNCTLQGPIYFDYGVNTFIGENFYANFNLTVLDVCPVKIGDNVFIGPNVSILTALHPLCSEERNLYKKENGVFTDKEYGAPITIESNVWIAGGVSILAGAKIGEGAVIGGGAVVTGEMPGGYLCCGVPCKPIRKITEKDSIENIFKDN